MRNFFRAPAPRFVTPATELEHAHAVRELVSAIDQVLAVQTRCHPARRNWRLIDELLDERLIVRYGLPVPVIPGRTA